MSQPNQRAGEFMFADRALRSLYRNSVTSVLRINTEKKTNNNTQQKNILITQSKKVTTEKVIAMLSQCIHREPVRSRCVFSVAYYYYSYTHRWKSPSLTICPKLFFEFCGNSVEIHVPTISLITAYRYTLHIKCVVCLCIFFYHHVSLYYRIHAQTHFHLRNAWISFHICTHKYLAAAAAVVDACYLLNALSAN